MWKIILILLAAAFSLVMTHLGHDPSAQNTKIGSGRDTSPYAYATGVRA
jgi:hypothetical protein